MKAAKWCLTCGKATIRCLCRQTLVAHDEAPVEEPERVITSSMMSVTYNIGKCKTVGDIFDKTFKATPKVRDHGTRRLR